MPITMPSGAVALAGTIAPTAVSDSYPTHEDTFGKGGHMSVDTLYDRNAIPDARRKEGMLVYVAEDQVTYQLGASLQNDNWHPFSGAGGGGGGGVSLPSGGSANQVLTKKSARSGDAEWRDIPVASSTHAGIVKPDNVTTAVDATGHLVVIPGKATMPVASDTQLGGIMGDGETISIDGDGVASINQAKLKTKLAQMDDVVTTDMSAKAGYFVSVNPNGDGFYLKAGASPDNVKREFDVNNDDFKLVYDLSQHMNTAISAQLECAAAGDLEIQYVSITGGDFVEKVDGTLLRYIPSRELNIKIYAMGTGKIVLDILSITGA